MRTARPAVDPKEAFFSRLPASSFTEYEDELLHALQLVTDLMTKWFPRSVSLQEWAERRIPSHLASSVNGSGIVFVEADRSDVEQDAPEMENTELQDCKRRRTEEAGAAQPPASVQTGTGHGMALYRQHGRRFVQFLPESDFIRQAYEDGRIDEQFWEDMENPNMPWKNTKTRLKGREHARSHQQGLGERFFKNLPEDRFTPEEDSLREAILNYIDHRTRSGSACYTTQMCEDPSVKSAKCLCIPPTMSLMLWCDKRMGQELHFEKVKKGHLISRLQQDSASL